MIIFGARDKKNMPKMYRAGHVKLLCVTGGGVVALEDDILHGIRSILSDPLISTTFVRDA
jgi:hypothetical protein